jgi:hypothetical protein
MSDIDPRIDRKTPLPEPEARRGVFGSRKFWFLSMEWSIIVFVVTLGLTALLWVYLTGADKDLLSFAMRRMAQDDAVVTTEGAVEVLPEVPRHPLDGMPMSELADRQVFAIAIDNIAEVRPQAGIAKARLVYEAPVEGGITRFLAFFAGEDDIERIGPVRSARPYFNEWAEEYGAAYGHVGGSPDALEKVKASGIRDINQYFYGAYFWRDKGHAAPHNVFTSTELLMKSLERAGEGDLPQEGLMDRFSLARDGERGVPSVRLAITHASDQYLTEWTYDEDTGMYARSQGGERTLDEDGSPVLADNVVVHFTTVTLLDAVGRRKIATVGKGDALIMTGGRAVEGAWSRDEGSLTMYADADGKPITLFPGTTWIQVVPEGTHIIAE